MGTNAANDLRCLGASTMQPLLVRWAHVFHLRNPQAEVEVGNSTRFSAAGVKAALTGRANCVSFAREPFPSEIAAFRQHAGRAPFVVSVAGGSYATPHGTFTLAIYVNRANPLRGLTLAQLATVFSGAPIPGGSRSMERWGRLGLRSR